jgi:DNA-binding IclR family transcriptional regulator
MPKSRERNRDDHSTPTLQEPRYSQSLERGLAILRCFTPARPVRGIADLADELGMSRSTTHRYMVTLVELGYLYQDPESNRKYRLSLKVVDIGMSAMNSLSPRQHAHPIMVELARELSRSAGHTVINLAMLDQGEVIYLDSVTSSAQYQLDRTPIGSHGPLYCTASGKLLLAYQPDQERKQAVTALTLRKQGPGTILLKRELELALDEITTIGLAYDEEESRAGNSAIAVPVRDADGQVMAALSAEVHQAIDADDMVMAFSAPLMAAAMRISARLGYRREDERRELGLIQA